MSGEVVFQSDGTRSLTRSRGSRVIHSWTCLVARKSNDKKGSKIPTVLVTIQLAKDEKRITPTSPRDRKPSAE